MNLIIENIVHSLITFGEESTQNFAEITTSIANCTINFKYEVSESVDKVISEAFFESNRIPEWFIFIWTNNNEHKIGNILNSEMASDLTLNIGYSSNNYKFAYDPSGMAIYALDVERKIGSIWISDEIRTQTDFFLTPFRAIFSWILNYYSGEIVHGACFSLENKLIALSGKSGSGKSVLAHKALAEQLPLVADDAFVIMPEGIFPIYRKIKLNYDIEPTYLGLSEDNFNHYKEKRVHQLKNAVNFPNKQIDYLFFPALSDNLEFKSITPVEAIKKLILENCTETIGTSKSSISRFSNLCKTAKLFTWSLSKDVHANFDSLRKFID